MEIHSIYFLVGFAYVGMTLLGYGLFSAWVEIRAMQQSTHKISFLNPFDKDAPDFQALSDEQKQKLERDAFENIM